MDFHRFLGVVEHFLLCLMLQERRRKRLERRSKGLRLGRRAVEEVKDERAMPERLGESFSTRFGPSGGAIGTAEHEKRGLRSVGRLVCSRTAQQHVPPTGRLRCWGCRVRTIGNE